METNYDMERAKPVVWLRCACCGAGVEGRQWWNRDTGYGVCVGCAEWMESRRESKPHLESEPVSRLYGVRGIHWGLTPAVQP